jgi:hypothetical protein
VVRVIAAEPGGASLGSGTLVDVNDQHGLVITNWHVVRDAPANVIVLFPDGFQSLGQVLRMDSNWDLAAILINRPKVAPVRVARDAPQIGESLTIAGYGSGNYRAVTGPCTQYLAPGLRQPHELIELAARARQGDSGGPILNSRGELAGVLFGEGAGRTTGAYCGRVHRFLAAAVEHLHSQGNSALASTPARSATGQTAANGALPPVGAGGAVDYFTAERTPADRSDTARPAISQQDVSASEARDVVPPSFDSAQRVASFEPVANESGRTKGFGSSAAVARTDTAASAPLALIEGVPNTSAKNVASEPATQPFSHLSTDATAPPRDPNPADEIGWRTSPWRFFAGNTIVDQLKTVLACIGALAILFYGVKGAQGSRTDTPVAGKRKSKRSESTTK